MPPPMHDASHLHQAIAIPFLLRHRPLRPCPCPLSRRVRDVATCRHSPSNPRYAIHVLSLTSLYASTPWRRRPRGHRQRNRLVSSRSNGDRGKE
jgi:hypothetical protein